MTIGLVLMFGVVRATLDSIAEFYAGHGLGGLQSVWSAMISAMILKPLHDRLSKWINRRIRGGPVDLKDDLPALIGDLRETEPTATIVDVVLKAVENGTHAQRAAIAFGGDVIGTRKVDATTVSQWLAHWQAPQPAAKKLERDAKYLQFPVLVLLKAEGMTGWLLVGLRPDNSVPSGDDARCC